MLDRRDDEESPWCTLGVEEPCFVAMRQRLLGALARAGALAARRGSCEGGLHMSCKATLNQTCDTSILAVGMLQRFAIESAIPSSHPLTTLQLQRQLLPSVDAICRQQSWQTRGFAAGATITTVDPADIEHATGLERQELEGAVKGKDIFAEEWINAPWGTEDKPVEVTSTLSSRIVGVPDPYDDSIIWWGSIHEGDPPSQIIEDGEFFVLKRLTDSSDPHGGGH